MGVANRAFADGPTYALLRAAETGNVAEVQRLIKFRISKIDAQDRFQNTALSLAAHEGHLDVVKFLVEKGANMLLGLQSPLHAAVSEGHMDVAEYLIGKGADIYASDMSGLTPFDYARMHKERKAFLHLFLGLMDEEHKRKALFTAVKYGHINVLEAFVETGALPLDVRNSAGNTPLMWAANHDNVDSARFLIGKGCKVNDATSTTKYSTLHIAASRAKKKDMIDLLAQAGANFRALSANNETPEEAAAWRERFDAVGWLREAEAAQRKAAIARTAAAAHQPVIAKPLKRFVLKPR